jgi:hypothetical protein|tara:strand:+ start:3697 stop:3798 length:102 start_codon:yes stop_codon:yes gene_type:complete
MAMELSLRLERLFLPPKQETNGVELKDFRAIIY